MFCKILILSAVITVAVHSLTGSINSGLDAHDGWFWLNGTKTRIFSGAMHYFRIPREYWQDRLIKLRASGCNAVETYIPWNLHEPRIGEFNYRDMLDLRSYVKLAQECGLFVIIRAGPFICAEWEFGGLPSWLLRDPNMKIRTTYQPFMDAVESYFKNMLPQITDLQYNGTKPNSGPIIAWQVENEYGSFGSDTSYLAQIRKVMSDNGVNGLFYTSNNLQGILSKNLNDLLWTVNFQSKMQGEALLEFLRVKQHSMPHMVMEFWTGWFDHWGDSKHHTWPVNDFQNGLSSILKNYGNVNFYMFHGGTNFGFMNGANEDVVDGYQPTVTSYDYDAPISESGQLTQKYSVVKELLMPYIKDVVYLRDCPPLNPLPSPIKYDDIPLTRSIPLSSLLLNVNQVFVKGSAIPMELLPINNNSGQSYGWTLYRKNITSGGQVKVQGKLRDRTKVYLNNEHVVTFNCSSSDFTFSLPAGGVLDLLIENLGRTNFQIVGSDVMNEQRKGLNNNLKLNGVPLTDYTVYPLDFSQNFTERLHSLKYHPVKASQPPAVYMGEFKISEKQPADTFLDMRGWGKGLVIINGRNLGRYWPTKGPIQSLYLPGAWLLTGLNKVVLFELETVPDDISVRFINSPIYGKGSFKDNQ